MILMDLTEIEHGLVYWTELPEYRVHWWAFVSNVTRLKFLWKQVILWLSEYKLFKEALISWGVLGFQRTCVIYTLKLFIFETALISLQAEDLL
jgi:hypothetical protein